MSLFSFRRSASWLPSTPPAVPDHVLDLVSLQLLLTANSRGAACHRMAPDGELVVPFDEVIAGLKALGFRLLRTGCRPGGDEPAAMLVHPLGCVFVEPSQAQPIFAISIDERQVAALQARLAKWVRPLDTDGGVLNMLQANRFGGVEFDAIGTVGRPLRRENYAPAVLDGIDHVVRDIEAAEPCGRISLLTGPPGTGKTHVLRGILASAKRPCFVGLQAGELCHFLSASPLSALMDFARDEAKDRPIVLIVEDADAALVPRAGDNMSEISALLNLSDGLIGSALDIRILATTNARHVEIDPAILRPGRLCRRIEVPSLDAHHATELLATMVGRPRPAFAKATTLAEVYSAARQSEHPPLDEPIAVGFRQAGGQ